MNISEKMSNEETAWQKIYVNNKEYLFKFAFKDGLWKILITDLITLWIDELSWEKLIDRCMKLNPALDIESFDAKSHINHLLRNIDKYATEISVDHIYFSNVIQGGVFKFNVEFKRSSEIQLWEEVTQKLCQSIEILTKKSEILKETIKNKDKEILEYKLEGAKLIRKNIETEPFDEQNFNNIIIYKSEKTDLSHIENIKDVLNTNRYPTIEHKNQIEIKEEKLFEESEIKLSDCEPGILTAQEEIKCEQKNENEELDEDYSLIRKRFKLSEKT